MKRANYIPAPHFFNLNHACAIINRAFSVEDRGCCYLVGSSIERRDYRDVDVRFIMSDADYDALFKGGSLPTYIDPRWSLICTSVATWLSQQTGLPIDFQIQRQTEANGRHTGQRHALGLFLDYPGERPSETP